MYCVSKPKIEILYYKSTQFSSKYVGILKNKTNQHARKMMKFEDTRIVPKFVKQNILCYRFCGKNNFLQR